MHLQLLLISYQLLRAIEGLASIVFGKKRRRPAFWLSESLTYGPDRLEHLHGQRSLIVYASTIGELNVVKPLLLAYRRCWPDDHLILFTAYEQYVELFARNYPDASIGLPRLRTPWLLNRFFKLSRPRLFLISEGPALHAHFPQRLEVALPAACLWRNVPVIVTNAALHKCEIGSRIDMIEHQLFRRLFQDAIRRWFTPYEAFQKKFIEAGVPSERIIQVGDLRFDSLHFAGTPRNSQTTEILDLYRKAAAPLFVAGSVNARDELALVISAWNMARRSIRDLRLVIAPRYVNNPEVIEVVAELLRGVDADFVLRTDSSCTARLADVLVIDVFGELSHFYSVATVSYIGRNHGVLEPIAYDCPTIVGSGWRRDFPAISLYYNMIEEGGVICAQTAEQLDRLLIDMHLTTEPREAQIQRAREIVAKNSGATERIIGEIDRLLVVSTMRLGDTDWRKKHDDLRSIAGYHRQ